MQPWRSNKIEERKGKEERFGHRNGASNQSQKRWNQPNSPTPSSNSISSSPMRQARLKPLPSSSSSHVPLELLSSPSRGLAPGTDASQDLTKTQTQNQFREFISQRIQNHVTKYGALQNDDNDVVFSIPRPSTIQAFVGANALEGQAKQSLQDILLFIRRLREGCVAADRLDEFVVDVYVLSTLLSILLGDNIQLNSSLPRLVRLIDLIRVGGSDQEDAGLGGEACQDIQLILSGKRDRKEISITKDCIKSLLLLWLCISGGETERLGGQQRKGRPGNSLEFYERKESSSKLVGESVNNVDQINKALARDDALKFRQILIDLQGRILEHGDHFWHFALLQRIVNEIRSRVWHTFKRSYMHLAVDPKLLGSESPWPPLATLAGKEDWAERMLLIDIEVMPLSEEERRKSTPLQDQVAHQHQSVPDSWDESVDELSSALQSTCLTSIDPLIDIRANRLAEALKEFELPQITGSEGTGLDRWKDRIVMQAGAPVIKLR